MSFLQSAPTVHRGIERANGARSKPLTLADEDDLQRQQTTHSTEGLIRTLVRLARSPTQVLGGVTPSPSEKEDEKQSVLHAKIENRKQILYARLSNVSTHPILRGFQQCH